MKIGIDIRNIGKNRTGDEVVFFNLVKSLALIDSENEYFLFTDILDKEKISEIQEKLSLNDKQNFKIVPLKASNKFIWNIWTLPKYLRQNHLDIYQTQYITPWFVPKSTRILTVIHDISFNFYPQFLKFGDLFFLKTLIPISLWRADKIIAVSKFTAAEIINYYEVNSKKVAWIHNAVSENFFQYTKQEEIKKVKKKYELPEKFILYLGTLQPRKNIPHLIRAFARIKDSLPDIKLVICGNKKAYNFDKKIESAVAQAGLAKEVYFPGYINEEDKQAIYKLAHVFVFPSLYEGFGIPILEAMAAGVPILASHIPPHKEIAEESVLFFENGKENDLENKLKEICLNNDLREKLIKKEKERINKFSWQSSAKEIHRIYTEFAG